MYIRIENLNIHYKVIGHGNPLLIIHGWGCSTEHFDKLQKHLAEKFTTYAIDLPGFGLSTAPEEIWGSKEYADLIYKFINAVDINNPVLIGHSFGGKIIINLVARDSIKIDKIVLIDSAGVRLPRSFKLILKIYCFKIMKFFIFGHRLELYKKKFGSQDYKNSSGHMRSILVKVVNEDITALLPKIKLQTLLLWGDKDTDSPIEAGNVMRKMIDGSKFIIFPGSGHFPFIDNYEKVVIELDGFLK